MTSTKSGDFCIRFAPFFVHIATFANITLGFQFHHKMQFSLNQSLWHSIIWWTEKWFVKTALRQWILLSTTDYRLSTVSWVIDRVIIENQLGNDRAVQWRVFLFYHEFVSFFSFFCIGYKFCCFHFPHFCKQNIDINFCYSCFIWTEYLFGKLEFGENRWAFLAVKFAQRV